MASQPVPEKLLQEALNALAANHGNYTYAAQALGLKRETFRHRVALAQKNLLNPKETAPEKAVNEVIFLKSQVRKLQSELVQAHGQTLNEDNIRNTIIKLSESASNALTPAWVTDDTQNENGGCPGVPTLFLSDLHWSEVVDPKQINNVNQYNLEIAHNRLRTVGERAVQLLRIISPEMNYPGLVMPLGGDMFSGNIHDELTATNEFNSMPSLLDLMGEMIALIDYMAESFGKVFLPCVTGNHGRATVKIWNKDRHATSFDWLLYQLLAKHYEKDERITFMIPDGPDAVYRIYSHRYLLTHGDQFRGGDSMIGCLGPIIRGDHKKRSRNGQIDLEYDTMILGHWHSYIHHSKVIVNGSLKGYDEYAYNNNFGFEHPQQALWITHYKHNITFRMPVYVGEAKIDESAPWVSI